MLQEIRNQSVAGCGPKQSVQSLKPDDGFENVAYSGTGGSKRKQIEPSDQVGLTSFRTTAILTQQVSTAISPYTERHDSQYGPNYKYQFGVDEPRPKRLKLFEKPPETCPQYRNERDQLSAMSGGCDPSPGVSNSLCECPGASPSESAVNPNIGKDQERVQYHNKVTPITSYVNQFVAINSGHRPNITEKNDIATENISKEQASDETLQHKTDERPSKSFVPRSDVIAAAERFPKRRSKKRPSTKGQIRAQTKLKTKVTKTTGINRNVQTTTCSNKKKPN